MTALIEFLKGIHIVPFQFFFLGLFVLVVITLLRSKSNLQEVIMAINSVGNQPTAIVVLVIGCIMLIESKQYGLDATVAGTIIGYGGNMLQNQLSAKTHTDSSGKTTVDTSTTPIPPTDPTNSTEPK